MSESVGRNEPCPCGSGKKYKKCCMNKEQVVQLKEVKEERFLQQKHQLTSKLRSFIHDRISAGETYQLETTFNKRSGRVLQNHKPFAQFWMYFFHRYENGLRGIEWFVQEQGHRLGEGEREMAERWVKLKPQLVQAVEDQQDHVLFEDMVSHERYAAPKSEEHLPFVRPWYGSLGLLEPKENDYYFNGMRVMVGPKGLRSAQQKAEEIQKHTDLSFTDVLVDYYPEVFAALHASIEDDVPAGELYEVKEYKYFFSVEDEKRAEAFFLNDHSFVIDQWTPVEKQLSWTGDWKTYEDNEMDGEILIADVYAVLSIKDQVLTVQTYSLESMNETFKKLLKSQGAFMYQDEKVTSFGNLPIQVQQKTVRIQEGVPQYFALYAQNEELLNVDVPIPKYYYKSLRQLVNEGHEQMADDWLKQNEYMVYDNVVEQFGEIDVTADFNKPREELGLSLSPFVTGGTNRRTAFTPAESPIEREAHVIEEDVPLYDDLGIAEQNKDMFYVPDFLRFYREKGVGKSSGTKRKYRDSLFDIREVMEQRAIQSWDDCDATFWEGLLLEDFFDLNEFISNTFAKDFVSVVKAFTKWLDKEKGLKIGKDVASLVKEKEASILNAVKVKNVIQPYPRTEFDDEFGSVNLENKVATSHQEHEVGRYSVEQVNQKSVGILNEDDQSRTLVLPEEAIPYVEEGMLISAEIGKSSAENWDMIELEQVYPAE